MAKKNCSNALEYLTDEIRKSYPRARVDVLRQTLGGFNVTVEVSVPKRSVLAATRKFASLANEIDDRFGVSILVMTGELESSRAA